MLMLPALLRVSRLTLFAILMLGNLRVFEAAAPLFKSLNYGIITLFFGGIRRPLGGEARMQIEARR